MLYTTYDSLRCCTAGMLNSFNSGAFQIACLRFLNTFVESAAEARARVHIQAELEEAGLDIPHLKRLVSKVGFRLL